MTRRPVLFAFALHLHQPVGNFDSVFTQHLSEVYRPLLRSLEAGILPATLHLSGPLLAWLERQAPDFLDELGRLVADGRIELLLSGHDEPILAALEREDRIEQIGRMREALARRFGPTATSGGLWLTERVWEPDLPADLVDAGIRYVLVDDRHFLVSGWEREALHLPLRTESGGRLLAVLPIDERLRYLVPFRPAEEFSAYVADLSAAGGRLALLGDDGEKFGGWPGTREWVYEKGWLAAWGSVLAELQESDRLELVTCSEALARLPSGGLAYLPTASYREMEGWALPTPASLRLRALEHELQGRPEAPPDGALIRGSHWRHFLVKYSEANAMHKKAQLLSRMCRRRNDPIEVRQTIGRAQCNDAYWHGVFGGLYLPHLRHAVWRNLARAEGMLRAGEPLSYEFLDVDGDGRDELWVHSPAFSCVVSPARGGRIEEYVRFADETNYAAVLTRRREPYHVPPSRPGTRAVSSLPSAPEGAAADGGASSIHELEQQLVLERLPPADRRTRALLDEYVLAAHVGLEAVVQGDYQPLREWHGTHFDATVLPAKDHLTLRLCGPAMEKDIRLQADGGLEVSYTWDPKALPEDARFAAEVTLAAPLQLEADAGAPWEYAVETVAKSEKGLERTTQGRASVFRWPVGTGTGRLAFRLPDLGTVTG